MNTEYTIHRKSNHPNEQQTAAFRYYSSRLISQTLTQKGKLNLWPKYLLWLRIMNFKQMILLKYSTKIV